jgi:hypothetical protein
MADAPIEVATGDGRDSPENVPACESEGLRVSEDHGLTQGNHDWRGIVVSWTIWGGTEVTTGGTLVARMVVIGGLFTGSGCILMVVDALLTGAGGVFFTVCGGVAIVLGVVGGFFTGVGCFLTVVGVLLPGAGGVFFTVCGGLAAVLGVVGCFFTGAGCFLTVVGVDFHPCFGGGFIPFGISTSSPAAFIYFSAPADPGHNPNARIPIISPKMRYFVIMSHPLPWIACDKI